MSQFGIIEITRQRMRPSLKRSIYFDCPHCRGAGLVKTPESMSLDVMRRLAISMNDLKVAHVEMTVCPDVAFYLQNRKRAQIVKLEEQFNKKVVIRSDIAVALDEARFELFDAHNSHVYLPELGMAPPALSHPAPRPGRGGEARFRQPPPRRDQRQPHGGRSGPDLRPYRRPPEPLPEESDQDKFDIENVEEELDRRDQAMDDSDAGLPPEADHTIAPPDSVPDEIVPESAVTGEVPVGQSVEHSEFSDRPGEFEDEKPAGRRRRRGRRGRGRGRGRPDFQNKPSGPQSPAGQSVSDTRPIHQRQDGPSSPVDDTADLPQDHLAPEPGNEKFPDEKFPDEKFPDAADGAPRRRRRRGGRRRRGRRLDSEQTTAAPALPVPAAAPPVRTPRQDEPRAREEPTLTRTGSADHHLVQDEPVAPQPVIRPRSHRDLDSIPDDYD